MFGIKDKDIRLYEGDLKALKHKAFPFAVRDTLNTAAFRTQTIARATVARKMVLRNKFTQNSIRVDRARGFNVRTMEAVVGSTQSYMEDQEFGVNSVSTGKFGLRLTTSYASGEGLQAVPRRRLAKRANKFRNIELDHSKKKGVSRKQKNLIAVKQAAASGDKYVFMDLGRKQGIFKVIGGVRKPIVRMVVDMTEGSTSSAPRPWLRPSFNKMVAAVPNIYKNALVKQLVRHGIFRGF